jgi:hypothetical protein
MREAIRQKLITSVASFGVRAFDPEIPDKKTEKPYVITLRGADAEESLWAGFRQVEEVWPYQARTNLADLDTLCNQCISALTTVPLTTASGAVFSCQYLGSGEDIVDAEWDIQTRALRFAVYALQPVNETETAADDPWLDALATWTSTELGVDWTVYQNYWPLGFVKPSVLWRIGGMQIVKLGQFFEVKKTFIGHVLGTPNQKVNTISQLCETIGASVKIPYIPANRKYLTVEDISGDTTADAIRTGQIKAVFSRKTATPSEEAAPVVTKVSIGGGVADPDT